TFGVSFLEVAGLIDTDHMVDHWARELLVGSARYSDAFGTRPLAYGSNFVARIDGEDYGMPPGQDVATSRGAIGLRSEVLARWFTEEEREAKQVLPFTLFDPELMFDYILEPPPRAEELFETFEEGKIKGLRRHRDLCQRELRPFIDDSRWLRSVPGV